MRIGKSLVLFLAALAIGDGLSFTGAPVWAAVSAIAICVAVFGGVEEIRRDLARIQCELMGHLAVQFKKNMTKGPAVRDAMKL